jgi:hypothetical protein
MAASPTTTNAIEEVKRTIPNFQTVGLEEGTRLLRQAALADFAATAKEMEAQVKEAQHRLTQAQSGAPETEQQAAVQHLQQLQSEQTEKLKQVAARSEARIRALQWLKRGEPAPAGQK